MNDKNQHNVVISDQFNWNRFIAAVFERWIPVALSGLVLASLNHLYWREKNVAELRQLITDEKVEILVEYNAASTTLFSGINSYVDYRDDAKPATNEDEYVADIDRAVKDLAAALTKAKLYFGKEYVPAIDAYLSEISSVDLKCVKEVNSESALF